MLAKPRLPVIPVLADADISSAGVESLAHPVPHDGGPYRDADPTRSRRERLARWLHALDEAETKRARVERELALLRELEPRRPTGGRGPLASRLGELAVMTLAASAFSAGLVTVTLDGVAQEPRREPAEEPREAEPDGAPRSTPAPGLPRPEISPQAEISPPIEAAPPPGSPARAETGLEVERIGRFERVLSRSFVERVLSTGGEGVRSARASLYERSGVVLGVRVLGVRSGSDLDALGIENGDVLVRLNGLPMSDPNAALEAYAALRASTHFELDLLRRGRPLRLRYTVLG